MNTEPAGMAPVVPTARTSRVECTFDNDPRLIVSLGAVISHAAKRAGLPEQTQQEVATAAVEASREMLISANGKGSGASKTKLVVEEFSDRLEVTIESSACARPEGIRKRLEGTVTDRVRCDGREGLVRVTLLKSCSAAKSGSTI
jgi:anti-sigma regulatory factor (Ser/Thr protein kinase)